MICSKCSLKTKVVDSRPSHSALNDRSTAMISVSRLLQGTRLDRWVARERRSSCGVVEDTVEVPLEALESLLGGR